MNYDVTSSTTKWTSPDFPSHSILSYQEAKSRLRRLTPGTEEYNQLQNALIKTTGIAEVHLTAASSYKVNTASKDGVLLGGFGSSEHVAIGKSVKLQGLGENPVLFTRGVTQIRFEHIVALAGDFYGIAGQAISLPGGEDPQKTERFQNAFDKLAQADHQEIRQLIMEIELECQEDQSSSLPHHCYSSHLVARNNAIKKIKEDVDQLLIDNSDHFSTNARDAYRIGHAYAMKIAREAGEKKDLKGLKDAYALEAFACHFLTDLFSAGHIRNQRGELETFLASPKIGFKDQAKLLAGILTGAQHEKDGHEGLNVCNDKGEHWRAFGDGCFLIPKNQENREKAIQTTQRSVDEIYESYLNPHLSIQSTIDQWIPRPIPLNPPPIYLVDLNEESLFVHQGGKTIKIDSKMKYLTTGISQALRYLPEEYISGFITPAGIEIPPLINKIIIPQIERLTGSVWHMVGLATYQQIKKESKKLNEQINEMADTLGKTYDNSVEILKKIEVMESQLHHLVWKQRSQDIDQSLSIIKDKIHEYKQYQRVEEKMSLWNALIRMNRVFSEGTADESEILVAYQEVLHHTTSMSPLEIKITITLWFRQMLDYQIHGFCLWMTLNIMEGMNEEEAQQTILKFESGMREILEINQNYIDAELICESQRYIELQLEKSQITRLALQQIL